MAKDISRESRELSRESKLRRQEATELRRQMALVRAEVVELRRAVVQIWHMLESADAGRR